MLLILKQLFDTIVLISCMGMDAMAKSAKNQISKERILDEAEILFADRGFHAVTVREITNAANCNLAAVNYHFGNKQKLYLEIFKARWVPRALKILAAFKSATSARDAKTPNDIIRALANAFLKGPFKDEERVRHAQLMIREMIRPSPALDMLVEEVMVPFFGELAGLLGPFMREGIQKERLMLNIITVFSMVTYFNFARAPVMRVTGEEYDDTFKDRLVDHIVQFSLTGLPLDSEEGVG